MAVKTIACKIITRLNVYVTIKAASLLHEFKTELFKATCSDDLTCYFKESRGITMAMG